MAAIAIAGEEGAVLSAQQASKLLNFALPTKGIQGIAINADSTRISGLLLLLLFVLWLDIKAMHSFFLHKD